MTGAGKPARSADALKALLRELRELWRPPSRMLPSEWAEANRVQPDGSAYPGPYRFLLTPYWREPVDMTVDKRVRRIVCRKSAQVGWTDAMLNVVGYRIDVDPCRILIMFPRQRSAIDFNSEKLTPMIQSSPALAGKVNTVSRSEGNRQLFKTFDGGWVKSIASTSPGDVKTTVAPLVAVEEPEDALRNVRGQGDSIKLAEERTKSFHSSLIIIGGTPTEKGRSVIDTEIEKTDQRFFHVPCHQCGEAAPLEWENLRWVKDATKPHPVYGKHHPETAHYVCTACGATWNDVERLRNIRRGKWIATRPFTGAAGFDGLNELYSPFPGAKMARIAEKYLGAHNAYLAGNAGPMIAFWNSSLGRSYEYRAETPPVAELQERAEAYPEGTVPQGGLALVMGIDVQGNRLAIEVRAYGRGMESWLVYWGEEFGAPSDRSDGVWTALDVLLERVYLHASGAAMHIEACSIDSSDGQSNDSVYEWVRARRHHRAKVMAIKGRASGSAEIFVPQGERSIDPNFATKASKYGLKVYGVGTERAKDLLLGFTADGGRIKRCDRLPDGTVRTGRGPGRMHWYSGVRSDYLEQLADSEVKAPNAKSGGKRVWTLKAGRRNEALDTCVYAEHAARALRLHLANESTWAAREKALMTPGSDADKAERPQPGTAAAGVPGAAMRVSSGFPIVSAVLKR